MLQFKTDDLHGIRWNDGERLDHLFEARCDRLEKDGKGDHPAVVVDGAVYSFRRLDEQANRFARYLIAHGVGAGDRIGLLFDKSFNMYVALLAVLKVNAAYVPLDGGFPAERIAFILQDAGVKAVVTTSAFASLLAESPAGPIFMDVAEADILAQPHHRLTDGEKGSAESQLAYIIYTSGTTGNPKGVVIEHPSICNFVRVAAETYGYTDQDRVYQGLTIAFDFSVEEIWVPLVVGATLVPGKAEGNLVGQELHAYLDKNRITALCCVPTLLATIEDDLPELRLLLVSGEACPQDLVRRWHRPGRTILNAYGPTEATVTATITELFPDKPVTIGKALPTYTIVLLDEQEDKLAAPGESGEIGIAGIGLAQGYLNREDLTRQKFIPDFLSIANNPSKRIYRTGDLGRFTDEGEIEYQGRIDTQIKIRGYRIELTEIESLIMRMPQVTQAVVATYEPEPGVKELVAYYSLKAGAAELDRDALVETMRAKLPSYMVPVYFEKLDIIPMTTSHKADRRKLPAPKGPRHVGGAQDHVAPRTRREKEVAATIANVMRLDAVSIKSNFFTELGAHSILMAQVCAALRQRRPGCDVALRDVYQNPTVEALALHLDKESGAVDETAEAAPRHNPSDLAYYGCGALQLATYFALGLFAIGLLLVGFHWTYATIGDSAEMYFRIFAFFAGSFIGLSALPIAVKWLFFPKWKAEVIPLWSLRYYQFWLTKLFVANAPVALFIGGPLYNVYLRLLGAKIGDHVVIRSSAPVCTDLFAVGDRSLIRENTLMPGYHAKGNFIHIGGTKIGSDVFVGSASMLDIDTAIGDFGQLGHSSTLQRGQRVPAWNRYHGTPAEPTEVNYRRVDAAHCSTLRRWLYTASLWLPLMLLSPLPIFILYHAFPYFYRFAEADTLDYGAPLGVIAALAPMGALISLKVFTIFALLTLIGVRFIPLIVKPFLREDRTYVLFGVHYFLYVLLNYSTNSGWMNAVFGDSSYIVRYLRWARVKFHKVVQTGANFGLDQIYDNPLLCTIGTGAMVSDGIAFGNLELSNSSFRLGRVDIGANSYLGNNIFFPAEAKVGANVLVGTKTMVPIDGPVRENTGLLGSPCFEIPRAVARDTSLMAEIGDEERRALLRRKDRYNIVSMLAYLLRDWVLFFSASLFLFVAVLYYPIYGAASLVAYGVMMLVLAITLWIVGEKVSLRFGKLEARVVNMYDPYFLFHERHWKLCVHPLMTMFNGTPMKNFITRALGVKLGRKVFDDGANLYDKTLIEIGDQANLNVGCVVQAHSLEEGVFKSERVVIGAGSSIGCAAYVQYGADIGRNAVLEPNACLMKGEVIPEGALWRGNPARSARKQGPRTLGLRAA